MPRSGKTVARGYTYQHKAERARWVPKVQAGEVACARCGQAIAPDSLWDLDHTDDRSGYNGPAHRSCNRRAGGIKRHLVRRGLDPQPRRWTL